MDLQMLGSILGLAGAGLLVAGVLVDGPRSTAWWLLLVGSVVLATGLLGYLVVDVLEAMRPETGSRPGLGSFYIVSRYGLLLGLLMCGPAFWWGRLEEKRRDEQVSVEREAGRRAGNRRTGAENPTEGR